MTKGSGRGGGLAGRALMFTLRLAARMLVLSRVGELELARSWATHLYAHAHIMQWQHLILEVNTLEICLIPGEGERIRALAAAMQRAVPEHYVRLFVDAGDSMARLLMQLRARQRDQRRKNNRPKSPLDFL